MNLSGYQELALGEIHMSNVTIAGALGITVIQC